MREPPTNPEPVVYQLRLVLRGVSPLIWRRLLVRSNSTIADLHATFRVRKVRELFSTPAERERAMEALVDDLGWRSAEMLKTYEHAITRAELRELLASSVRQMLEDAPRDAASLQAVLRGGVQASHVAEAGEHSGDVLMLSDEARQTLAWIEVLDAG